MHRRSLLVLATSAGLVACGPQSKTPPPLRFDQLPPINLAIATFGTEERMQPVEMDFIDRRRSDELINVTREYLSTRFLATGGTDAGLGLIEEASVIERPQPAAGVVSKVTGTARELFGTLSVRVAVVDGFNIQLASAQARFERRQPVAFGTATLERDRLARELARDLVTSIDGALVASVRENLASYIASA